MIQNELEFNAAGVEDNSYMSFLKEKFNKGGIITQTELGKIVPRQQFQVMLESKEEYPFMIENIKEAYENIPPLYAQDGKGKNAVVWLHYFSGASDWYITELDKKENRAFGYTILNGDVEMSKLGYISIDELTSIDVVNLDLYWSVQTLNQVFQSKYPMLVSEPVEIYEAVEELEVVEDSKLLDVKFANVFERNLAIRELVDEKGDNTNNYTVEEKEFISQYSGMGGLEKYGATGKGLLYEYYTPNDIIEKMWGLAYKHKKIEIKDVLEPSCGVGRFLGQAPQTAGLNFECYDIDKYALTIAEVLYPDDDLTENGNSYAFYLKSFETNFIKNNKSVGQFITRGSEKFDLVIGNPPYGKYSGMYAGMGEKKATGATNYVEYFITRGLDLLRKDGLLIYIIGTVTQAGGVHFLDKKPNNVIKDIMEKSELVDAYRLGVGMFDETDVDSEIIVLRKK